jgi:peptide chain release factor 1
MTNFDNPYQTQLDQIKAKINDNQELLKDPELKELAQVEIKQLKQQQKSLQQASDNFQQSLAEKEAAEKDPTTQSPAILELRAGAGGDEAKIWADDLLRMYLRYLESKGLKTKFIDDTVVKVTGQAKLEWESEPEDETQEPQTVSKTFFPYQLLKQEAGVHRVQRVPTTETQGRIHTSTASLAVLPEIKPQHVKIKDEDLEWEFMRSSGAGGQSVNKTSSAVRLTHQPSGIVVRVSQERKQLQNRQIALDLLRAQLWEKAEAKRQAKLGKARAAIGRNRRSEKIRTYNFPQNRVTDHRINESWYDLDSILEGDLDKVITTAKTKLQQQAQDKTD